MPFKLSLVADVRAWLAGTKDVQNSLEEVADSLDNLARDTENNAEDAADNLEAEFSRAFDRVKDGSKTTGRKLGDELTDGTDRAATGMDNLGTTAAQNAADAVAGVTDISSALDAIEDQAPKALAGLGPAGAVAGAVAGIGLGLIKESLEIAKEQADDYVEKVHEIAGAMRDAGNDAAGLADTIADSMTDIVDEKRFYEFWQSVPVDRLTAWSNAVRDLGVTYEDVFAAAAGDLEAYDRIQQTALANVTQANIEQTTILLDGLHEQGRAVADAQAWNRAYADSTVAAHQRAAEASKEFSKNLADHMSVADDGLNDFVKDGVLSLDQWSKELAKRADEAQAIQDFTVDIAPKLSPAALENLAKLPTETQAQIAKAYADGSTKDQAKIVANLEAEVKVLPTQIDVTEAQAAATATPIDVPTRIITAGLPGDVRAAAATAQQEASRHDIVFTARLDAHDLQSQVDRAAAAIRRPTIYANVKPKKEVP